MDLILMDLILKGIVPERGRVLDIGCGEGRNGIYFIQKGYEYHGWDTDRSKLRLIEYLAKNISGSDVCFEAHDLRLAPPNVTFDFIICSRLLHFAHDLSDFMSMWKKVTKLLKSDGILYVSMDSTVDVSIGEGIAEGKVMFPDGKLRFALTKPLYARIKTSFEEVMPLRTLVHHGERAQSFFALRKTIHNPEQA